MSKRMSKHESWIKAASLIKRGWLALPNHAHGGRHASCHTRRGRRIFNRVYGTRMPLISGAV